MPTGRILSKSHFGRTAEGCFGRICLRQACALDVAKPKRNKVGDMQLSFFINIAKRMCSCIPKRCCIRLCADAYAVKNDQNNPFFHAYHNALRSKALLSLWFSINNYCSIPTASRQFLLSIIRLSSAKAPALRLLRAESPSR